MFLEISESFRSLDEWTAWIDLLPQLRDQRYINDLAHNIMTTGFDDPTFGLVRPRDIKAGTSNYREGFQANGATCRYRALLTLAIDYALSQGWCSPVYLAEQSSDFAEHFPARFPYVMRSEYLPDAAAQRRLPYIRHEDPMRLSMPDRSFNLYISADSMIYAPSMEGFLREAHRILRREGVLLATFPFRYGEPDSEIKAKLVNGEVVHRSAPLYHDDPVDPGARRLVFFEPGWDILEVARMVGFRSAEMVIQSSRKTAIMGTEIAGVFVLRATV